MQLTVKTGEEGEVILRSEPSTGYVEFCKYVKQTDKDTLEEKDVLVAFKFYTNLEQAFQKVASMRIASIDAKNIQEVVAGIKLIRADIKREMGVW